MSSKDLSRNYVVFRRMDALFCCYYTSFPLFGAERGLGDGEVDDSAETLLPQIIGGLRARNWMAPVDAKEVTL